MDELESKGSESSANGPTLAKPHDSQGGGSHPIPLPLADSPSKKLRALPLRTQSPSCQVEKCSADLSNSKDYYRRHRVCEVHSKAPAVTVLALEQRFCQQCSRFHILSEFDEAKRSCRRRLAGHNERRRKTPIDSSAERLGASHGLSESWRRHMEETGRMAMVLERNATVKICKEIK